MRKRIVFLIMFLGISCLCFGGSKPEKLLFNAIDDKKLEDVKAVLPQVGNLEEKNFWGDTPLTLAIKRGDLEIVKALVDGGVNAMAVTKKEETMFYFALKENKNEIAKYLAEKGSDIKKEDKSTDFPLLTAVEKQNTDLVKFILEKGENPNRENKKAERAITIAVKEKSVEIIELLIKYKADIKIICDDKQNTLLHIATERKNYGASEIFIKSGADINAKNRDGETSVEIAAKKDETITVLLVNNGVNLSTAVYEAVISNNSGKAFKAIMEKETRDIKTIEIYSKSFGDIFSNTVNKGDKAALQTNFNVITYAIKKDSDKIMEVLIDKNYKMNYLEIYREVLDTNKLAIMKMFLDKGKVMINEKINGKSQLFYLIDKPRKVVISETKDGKLLSESEYKQRLPLIEELSKRGAAKKEKDDGVDLISMANSSGLLEVVEILKKYE